MESALWLVMLVWFVLKQLKLHEEMFGAALKPNRTHVFLLAPAPEPLSMLLVVISERFGTLRGVNSTAGSDSSTTAAVSASVGLTAVRGQRRGTQIVFFLVDTFDCESNKATGLRVSTGRRILWSAFLILPIHHVPRLLLTPVHSCFLKQAAD